MAWDFETDSDFQAQLDWMDEFVRTRVEPLDEVLGSPYDVKNPANIRLVRPLQAEVKQRGLWACHLGAELGGPGFGQVKLALMNEILGRSFFAPTVFGCQAPDSGNAEILAHFGTDAQKARWLQPLLANEIVSCFAMTEPQGGADPAVFTTQAVRDGDEWVISGEKWFASNGRFADFFIVVAVTDPEAPLMSRQSMFIVPADTPGVEIVRNVGMAVEKVAGHAYMRFEQARVPADHVLGGVGQAFVVAQTRLGGGRVHHAMRTLGEARKVFEMTCERVVSRHTKGEPLARKQLVQEKIADSWIEMEQFRLFLLRTAWRIDKYHDYKRVLKDIAAIKALMPKLLHDIATRAVHLHGSIGVSDEMPFVHSVINSMWLALADGPTEVHKVTVARQLLEDVAPSEDLFPSYHLPRLHAQAMALYGDMLEDLQGVL
jgi:acyl-CoA dehydrogenase